MEELDGKLVDIKENAKVMSSNVSEGINEQAQSYHELVAKYKGKQFYTLSSETIETLIAELETSIATDEERYVSYTLEGYNEIATRKEKLREPIIK